MRILKSALYHYGLGAGVPFDWLRPVADAIDFARAPTGVVRRRRVARALRPTRGDDLARAFARQGYALFDRGAFPELDKIVTICRRLRDLRAANLPPLEGDATLWHLLQPEDLAAHPELMAFALSDRLVSTVVAQIGTLPRLQYLGLWLSPPMPQLRGSHHFHLDKPDAEIVGVFVNIEDVALENGPLTFLPAEESADVCRHTRYHRRASGRLEDDEVFAFASAERLVRLTGPAGSGGIVNTSRCLHLGSRCTDRPRLVFAIKYALAQKALPAYAQMFDGHLYGRDPVRRLMLEGSRPRD
jgi:hypothetical protein